MKKKNKIKLPIVLIECNFEFLLAHLSNSNISVEFDSKSSVFKSKYFSLVLSYK